MAGGMSQPFFNLLTFLVDTKRELDMEVYFCNLILWRLSQEKNVSLMIAWAT